MSHAPSGRWLAGYSSSQLNNRIDCDFSEDVVGNVCDCGVHDGR